MSRRFFVLLILLSLKSYLWATANWLDINIWADISASRTSFSSAEESYSRAFFHSRNNIFTDVSALSPGGLFGADILLSLEQRYTKRNDEPAGNQSETNTEFNLLNANISLNTQYLYLRALRLNQGGFASFQGPALSPQRAKKYFWQCPAPQAAGRTFGSPA